MAKALTAALTVKWESVHANTLLENTPSDALSTTAQLAFTPGTGVGQVDLVLHSRQVINAATELHVDLKDAATVDQFGAAISFVKVKAFVVRNLSTVGGTNKTLQVGGNALALVGWVIAAANEINIPPNGVFAIGSDTGFGVVGAGASDILDINNGGAGTCEVEYWIIGTSA